MGESIEITATAMDSVAGVEMDSITKDLYRTIKYSAGADDGIECVPATTNDGEVKTGVWKVSGLKNSTATITFYHGAIENSCVVKVSGGGIGVTGVNLSVDGLDKANVYNLNKTEGSSIGITASIVPAEATNKEVQWINNNKDVVDLVDTDDSLKKVVKAKGVTGYATILVMTEDGFLTDRITISVQDAKLDDNTSIKLLDEDWVDKATDTISVSGSTDLRVVPSPAGSEFHNVVWESSDPTVATVTGYGDNNRFAKVSGLKADDVTITAKVYETSETTEPIETKKFAVTVVNGTVAVSDVKLNTSSATVLLEKTYDAEAKCYPTAANKSAIVWSTGSNTSDYVEITPDNSDANSVKAKLAAKKVTHALAGGIETVYAGIATNKSMAALAVTVPNIDAKSVDAKITGEGVVTEGETLVVPVGATLTGTFVVLGDGNVEATNQTVTLDQTGNILASITPSGANTTTMTASADVASGTIVVTATNGVVKTIDVKVRKAIANSTIAAIADQTFKNAQIKPTVNVTYNGTTLVEGTDYACTYGENKNVKTGGTVTITGKGDYFGTTEASFKITPAAQTITQKDQTVNAPKTVTLKPSANGKGKLSYAVASKYSSIISVTGKGVVTGKKAGVGYVTVTAAASSDGNYAKTTKDVKITVKQSQTITQKDQSVVSGRTVTLKPVANGKGALSYSVPAKYKEFVSVNKNGVVRGLKKGTGYVTVTAAAKGNYLKTSKNVKITVNVPKAVTAKATSKKKAKQVDVSWNAVACSGYEVQVSYNRNFKKVAKTKTIKNAKAKSASITGLTSKKACYVRVYAYGSANKDGYRSVSKIVTVKKIK